GWMMPLRLLPDFNICLDLIDRGGSIDSNLPSDQVPEGQLPGMLAGDHTIAFDRKLVVGRIVQNNGVVVELDLGARFGVNRIVFYPRMTPEFPFGNEYLRAFELYVNDGLPRNLYASGQPIYTSPAVREPDNHAVRVEAMLEAQFVRFMRLKSITTVGFEIDEIEVYGTGFVPEASYESAVLDLGEPRVWGVIRWLEQRAGGASQSEVEIRARSGRDNTPDVYYRILKEGNRVVGRTALDANGDTLTKASYEALLRRGERGEKEPDGVNWSPWQLLDNGATLNLPAPRRYVQLRADFTNLSLDASRALGQIAFTHDAPALDGIVAEIGPARVEAGERTTFTFVARAENRTGRRGFDRFQIETPARVAAIRSVEIQDRQLNRLDSAEFGVGTDLSRLPVSEGSFTIETVADDYFVLRVPRIAADGTRLRIVFDAAAFRYNTRFEGRAYTGSESEIPQLTEGGDASPELDTDGLLVRVSLGSDILKAPELDPPVLTPNGDGVNDEVEIAYTVLHLLEPSPATVTVYDLAGRAVRRLDTTPVENGRFAVRWNGRTDGGSPAPPGLYLVAVEVTSDARTERRVSQVAVAY
ncbi:MAG: FlgD immunoglobulin-like domain containing protein, partial [Gemmatimonadota bacterium]